jgi:hypothetical protein
MPLPAPGVPLSLSQIQTEFGGTNPISLSEYYAGGGLVPSGTSGTNGAVPSSGTISINNFYGTSAVVYRLDSDVYIDTQLSPDDAQVDFFVNSNGTILATAGISFPFTLASYNWLTPTTGSTTYYVRATLTSGTFTSGTTGTWLALTSNHSWRTAYTFNTPGNKMTTATFEIATDSGGTNVVVSASISLEAFVDSF